MEIVIIGPWTISVDKVLTSSLYENCELIDQHSKPYFFCLERQDPNMVSVMNDICVQFGINPRLPFRLHSFFPNKRKRRFTGTIEYLIVGSLVSGEDLGNSIDLDRLFEINNIGVGFSRDVPPTVNVRPIIKVLFFGDVEE